MKTILITICLLCLAGCLNGDATRTTTYPDGRVVVDEVHYQRFMLGQKIDYLRLGDMEMRGQESEFALGFKYGRASVTVGEQP